MADFIARILLVDDQPASVGLLMAYLEDRDIDLLVAQNGEDALRIAADGRPNLILLDVLMPGADGFSVCARLEADSRTAKIPVPARRPAARRRMMATGTRPRRMNSGRLTAARRVHATSAPQQDRDQRELLDQVAAAV
jgi:CheY-like chemotaxis protein